jgi:hypothetical protein
MPERLRGKNHVVIGSRPAPAMERKVGLAVTTQHQTIGLAEQ